MKHKFVFIILFFCFLFMISSVSTVEASQKITVSADAHVISSMPDTNFGVENGLSVFDDYEEYGDAYSWLKFQIPSGSDIKTAKLYLKQDELLSGDPTVGIHLGSNVWTEMGITWNNQPGYGSAFDSTQITEKEKWYSWTVTSKISAGETVTFVLKTSTSSAIAQFYSKEWGYAGETEEPYIEITFWGDEEEEGPFPMSLCYLPFQMSIMLGLPSTANYFAGRILVSMFFMFSTMVGVAIYSKQFMPTVIGAIIIIGCCIAIGWLEVWFLIIDVLLTVVLFRERIMGGVD